MSDNSLTRERWVRIEVEFDADGVWDRDGAACPADCLPVSPDLIARIRAWQHEYDSFLPAIERMERDGRANELRDNWVEGFQIAIAVKTELPDWTVVVGDAPFEFVVVPRATSRSRARTPD